MMSLVVYLIMLAIAAIRSPFGPVLVEMGPKVSVLRAFYLNRGHVWSHLHQYMSEWTADGVISCLFNNASYCCNQKSIRTGIGRDGTKSVCPASILPQLFNLSSSCSSRGDLSQLSFSSGGWMRYFESALSPLFPPLLLRPHSGSERTEITVTDIIFLLEKRVGVSDRRRVMAG
jgi:hypothetical protein